MSNISSNATLIVTKIGYSTLTLFVKNIEKGTILYLSPNTNTLNEVIIRGFSSSQLKKVESDQVYFSQKDIEKLPFILGEKDVIKLIQYTPGVQQATEGQSGLLVRGGNGSMNLTLLDQIYLHNTAHLGGLFSALNSDFINSLEFSKAGFDASYGGRLSSITNVKSLKPIDSTTFKGSIGFLAAKLTGNIKLNKKNNLLVSGRRTYLEVFKPFFGDDTSVLGNDKNYFLHDFLTKHTFQLSPKDKIESLFFVTKDQFNDKTKGRNRNLSWGNTLLGTTYSHIFTDILSSQTTLANSYYKLNFSDNEFPFDYKAKSTYNSFNLSHQFLWNHPNHILKIGASFNKNTTLPKRVQISIDDTPLNVLNQESFDYNDISIFSDTEFSISSKLKTKTGLRLTSFLSKPNALVNRDIFYSIEPRVSMKYALKKNQALKFSYQRLSQFIHQASISSVSLPIDFFVVSTKEIKPQIVNQLSFGYVYEQNGFQLNTSTYYKKVSNYTEFINGAVNNLFSNNIYEDIAVGKFNSYGLELSVNKKTKRLTAQSALTLSRTFAKFKEINQGNYFPTTFDRPININTIFHYKLNKNIELGALFLFSSGQNFTRPNDIRIINEDPILNFEAKNASRFPNYHRLDLSCTYSFKSTGKWKSKLNLTLYNVYNNANPFQILYSVDQAEGASFFEINEEKETLFPFLPTLNWLFSF